MGGSKGYTGVGVDGAGYKYRIHRVCNHMIDEHNIKHIKGEIPYLTVTRCIRY